jgi:hypothetical protein
VSEFGDFIFWFFFCSCIDLTNVTFLSNVFFFEDIFVFFQYCFFLL